MRLGSMLGAAEKRAFDAIRIAGGVEAAKASRNSKAARHAAISDYTMYGGEEVAVCDICRINGAVKFRGTLIYVGEVHVGEVVGMDAYIYTSELGLVLSGL